jgi:hypothetical protein
LQACLNNLRRLQHSFLLDHPDLLIIWEVHGMTKLMLRPRHEPLEGEVEVRLMLHWVVIHPEGAQMLEGG